MGYDREYTKSLKTWKDRWWEFDRHGNKLPRTKQARKKTDPRRVAFDKAWRKGERDFTKLMEIIHG